MSKSDILGKIRAGKHYMEMIDGIPSPDPVGFIKDDESGDMYVEFKTRITENKSIVVESSKENLAKDLNEIIKNEGAKSLIYPNGELPFKVDDLKIEGKFKYDKAIEEFKQEIFNYDISVIEAFCGVSSHGVCGVASSPNQPRLMSLTPKVCVMLLKKENIVKSLSKGFAKIKEKNGGKLPTNVLYISGPSRTADIELQTVLGVHGSQIAYVVIY